MLQCALKDRNEFRGFIGFESPRREDTWSDEQKGTLIFVSRIIGLFLVKRRDSEMGASSRQRKNKK